MIEIGRYNSLKIARIVPPGAILIDEEENEVLLPNKYVPQDAKDEDVLDVFVYTDSEDRIVATTLVPKVMRNEFACLEVKDVNNIGAFMDMGLEKDLLVPFSEQQKNMRPGQWHMIYMYLDQITKRLAASAKVHYYIESEHVELEKDEEVDLIIGETTPLGTAVIVNNKYQGLVYENEVFQELLKGEKMRGYVKEVREDGKVDISLRKTGLDLLEDGAARIIERLKLNNGKLALHDKSSPEEIQMMLQMSKKNFKRSLGNLYKEKLIVITDQGIELVS
ncbi:S1-like domain-containing RNA-binding protein [Reichenbachiella carrageenanivorans]|uniref:S1-like domain-containing RNA-binding protein n=1 Tax=Reichenbachiella carrageenanivorans TaxID=2979869 RepID=A0ABY6CXG7_9BACT|nr:S1-like domain-containing RNA-binding protein [Reichenbachiella carrageenanivorans]UXX78414.1 S1-like domain-containing RNA-binding protein [Reichenbachiella carrageenanivorans]